MIARFVVDLVRLVWQDPDRGKTIPLTCPVRFFSVRQARRKPGDADAAAAAADDDNDDDDVGITSALLGRTSAPTMK